MDISSPLAIDLETEHFESLLNVVYRKTISQSDISSPLAIDLRT